MRRSRWPVTRNRRRDPATGSVPLSRRGRSGEDHAGSRYGTGGRSSSDGSPNGGEGGSSAGASGPGDRDSSSGSAPDGGSGADGSEEDSTTSAKNGATGDALAASVRDRQILVVGCTVAGLALASFLDRGGYDPVVLSNAEPREHSRTALLWPRSVDVLDGMGVDAVPRERRAVGRAAVHAAGERVSVVGEQGASREARPVAVPTERLREELKGTTPDTSIHRDVSRIDSHDGSLEVTFDDGVREWFDAVVAADGPGSSIRSLRDAGMEPPQLDQFETTVSAEPDGAVDAWTDGGLAQLQPLPGVGETLLRLTLVGGEGAYPDRIRRHLSAVESGPLAGIDVEYPPDARYASVAQTGGSNGHWGRGRVAYCGASALSLAPATGLRTALAIEDAWVLADELVRGSRSVDDAIHTYAGRRERRVERLLSAGTDATAEPTGTRRPGLSGLERFRRAALAVLDDATGRTPGPDP